MLSGNLFGISCGKIVSRAVSLSPLVEDLSTQFLLTDVLCTGDGEPVPSHNSASVGSIAAVAAEPNQREDDVSLSLTDELSAGSGGVGDSVAEGVVLSVGSVQSLHPAFRVEPELTNVMVLSGAVALNEVLLEADRPDWGLRLGEHCKDEGE